MSKEHHLIATHVYQLAEKQLAGVCCGENRSMLGGRTPPEVICRLYLWCPVRLSQYNFLF